jgi:hypothetical protein
MPLQPTFTHVLVPELLPPDPDIRDRTSPEYHTFEASLGADIMARGVNTPLLAYEDDKRPRVLDGETRRRAMLLVGYTQPVPILLYPSKPSESDRLSGSLSANAMRRDHTDLEYAAVYVQLMTLNKWTPAELFRQLHINPSTGHKRLAVSKNLCEQVQAWVTDGSLSVRAAYALSRLKDHAKQVELAERYRYEDRPDTLCAEGVEAEVGKLLGSRKPKDKPLTLRQEGIALMVKKPTADGIRAFLEKLASALKRLKTPDDIGDLPFYFKTA